MDKIGIDVQARSLTVPGVQSLASENAIVLRTCSNDPVAEYRAASTGKNVAPPRTSRYDPGKTGPP